ncbi:unnamed protein product [marine sediment metagenome]|uniref:Uncharacterized protein n=1 Tax=marine sediment metagenome TaxID=412755 RepID=X1VFK3_9ZZZZ
MAEYYWLPAQGAASEGKTVKNGSLQVFGPGAPYAGAESAMGGSYTQPPL